MKNTIERKKQRLVRKMSRTTAKSKRHIERNFLGRLSHIENIRLLIFEWGLLVFALIMLAATQAFWFAHSYAEDTFGEGGTYSEATLGTVSTLNPWFATTSSEKTLSRLMFATLAANDYSGHPGLGLAESIRSSENGRVWTVKLRNGLKWSDGEPITNADVLWSINAIKDPAVKSVYDANLAGVEAAENEAGEIVLSLPQPYADFIAALEFPVLPKHKLENADLKRLAEDAFSTAPVTSGPFKFNAMQTTGAGEEKVYYLSANPDYYRGEPLVASFAVQTYTTREALIQALKAGVVTATAELTDVESAGVAAPQLTKKNAAMNSGVYLFFNTRSLIINSREMRRAIREGLDIEAIREVAVDTAPLDYPLVASQIELENWPALPEHNFEAGKAAIEGMLWGDEAPTLEIATVNSGFMPEVAQKVAEQLATLGFKTNVSVYDEGQQDYLANRAYDILIYEIGLGADPDLLPYYHSTQINSGLNLANYQNVMADDAILGARNTMDGTLRAKKYEMFLNYWVNDVPAIGLYQVNLTYLYNQNVRTFGNNVRLVTGLDRFSDVTEWAVNKETRYRTP